MAKELIRAELGGTPLTAEELSAIPDFKGIRKEIWDKFPGAIARQDYKAGDIIMREGESGTTAFYILSGTVEIFISHPIMGVQSKRASQRKGFFGGFTKLTNYVKGVPEQKKGGAPQRTHIPIDGPVDLPMSNPVAEIGPGDMIGELAALAALKQEKGKRAKYYPRSATVRAKTAVTVFEMLPNILNNVLYTSKDFKERLDKAYVDRALGSHLRSVPVFGNLSDAFLKSLRPPKVELVSVLPGQVICKQGDVADALYLIRLGFVKVSQDFPGGELVLTYLSRGSYFGEMGLLPPAFRVRAKGKEPGQVAEGAVAGEALVCGRSPEDQRSLSVPWDEFVSRRHFQLQVEGKAVRVTRLPSGKNPITFRDLPADTFLASPGDKFVIGNTTFELLEDPFQTGRRTATCTAVDYVQLVKIKADVFAEMIRDHPDVEAQVTEVARSRRQMDAQILNRVQTVSLNTFLEQELMQGQNLLLIDLQKCTRCDECVKACVATHDDGVTRLIRDGLRFDKYLVPTSCRACMDPLCMTNCPVGAIRRKETLDIVIEDWCIGCSNCARDCPYGNINVTMLPDLGGGAKQKAEMRPKAVVCDLCADYQEPNCVRACPHEAAIRVEPKSFFAQDLVGPTLAVAPTVAPSPAAPAPQLLQGEIPSQAVAPEAMETQIYSNIADLLNLMPRLRVVAGVRAGSVLQLRYPETTFGRSAEADYRFQDDEKMSRMHCSIVCENSRFLVRDNNSTNGTLVNGNPVSELELRGGDVIEIGGQQMEFLAGQGQPQ